MALFEIPIDRSNLFWTQQTSLDGIVYRMQFRYNRRIGHYIMDFVGIVEGIHLVNTQSNNLLKNVKYLDLPQGDLYLLDKEGNGNEADINTFGNSTVLVYDDGN